MYFDIPKKYHWFFDFASSLLVGVAGGLTVVSFTKEWSYLFLLLYILTLVIGVIAFMGKDLTK